MNGVPDRLYGLPWAEILYRDPVEVYEHVIDGTESFEPVEIEEWTVSDNRRFMPSVDRVLDELNEIVANDAVTEEWYEAFQNAEGDVEVVAAFQTAIDLLASKVRFWMADKVVATHTITWDDSHRPLLDGAPLYSQVAT